MCGMGEEVLCGCFEDMVPCPSLLWRGVGGVAGSIHGVLTIGSQAEPTLSLETPATLSLPVLSWRAPPGCACPLLEIPATLSFPPSPLEPPPTWVAAAPPVCCSSSEEGRKSPGSLKP